MRVLLAGPRRYIAGMLAPWLVGSTVLIIVPMAGSLALSLLRLEGGLSSDRTVWVGADHYARALGVDHTYEPTAADPWYWHFLSGKPVDEAFYTSLYNSLIYCLFAVPLGLAASLIVALLLNRSFFGGTVVRACVYLPHVLGGVATIVIWSWLLNPRFGWINQAIRTLYAGLDPLVRLWQNDGTRNWPLPDWLYSPAWCKPAVVLIHVWTMGGAMLVFLAALRRVPGHLHDAVNIDGGGRWSRFRHVTWPMITPAVLFNAVVSLVFTMQSFNEAYLLQNSGQKDGLLFYVLYLYRAAFEPPYRLGYACALAWILLLVLAVLVVPLLGTSRRWVYEAGSREAR